MASTFPAPRAGAATGSVINPMRLEQNPVRFQSAADEEDTDERDDHADKGQGLADGCGVPEKIVRGKGHHAGAEGKAVKDISRTRLAPYEAAFDAFLRKLEGSIRAERVRSMSVASLDF